MDTDAPDRRTRLAEAVGTGRSLVRVVGGGASIARACPQGGAA